MLTVYNAPATTNVYGRRTTRVRSGSPLHSTLVPWLLICITVYIQNGGRGGGRVKWENGRVKSGKRGRGSARGEEFPNDIIPSRFLPGRVSGLNAYFTVPCVWVLYMHALEHCCIHYLRDVFEYDENACRNADWNVNESPSWTGNVTPCRLYAPYGDFWDNETKWNGIPLTTLTDFSAMPSIVTRIHFEFGYYE